MKLYSYPMLRLISQGDRLRTAKPFFEVQPGLLTYLCDLLRTCEATLRTIRDLTEAYT